MTDHQHPDIDAGARRDDGVRRFVEALVADPPDPAVVASATAQQFTQAFEAATRRRNTNAAQAIQSALGSEPPADPPPQRLSSGTNPDALNTDPLLADLKRRLGITSSYSLDNL